MTDHNPMPTPSRHPSPNSSPEIVARYLTFFRARDHLELPGMHLAAPNLTTSFVIAGMQPMIPYLRGEVPPPAPRLTSFQRCLRTDDADAVGTNGHKCTSFHMLGNWSIGDYGRRAAIEMALALLDELGLPRDSLWMTYFGGDPTESLPPDDETPQEWRRLGIPSERLVPLGLEDNFWTLGGPGPCGPDSEIFVDRGEALSCGRAECRPGCACERFLEIWNLVFTQYEWLPDGTYAPLPLRSVDTGMGLERVAAVLQGTPTVFETDLFAPARARLETLADDASIAPPRNRSHPNGDPTLGASGGHPLPERWSLSGSEPQEVAYVDGSLRISPQKRAQRMIVDHARAALFALLAGVAPDRIGRGSVVRRLIRRAARQGRLLGIERPFLGELLEPLARAHGPLLTEEERARVPALAHIVTDEERRFSRVLTIGLRELTRLTPGPDGRVPGERIYALLADRGFPPDLAAEVLAERGLTVEWPSFERARDTHHAISRPKSKR